MYCWDLQLIGIVFILYELSYWDLFGCLSNIVHKLPRWELFGFNCGIKLFRLRSRLLFNEHWDDFSVYFKLCSRHLFRGRSVFLHELSSWILFGFSCGIKLFRLRSRLFFNEHW